MIQPKSTLTLVLSRDTIASDDPGSDQFFASVNEVSAVCPSLVAGIDHFRVSEPQCILGLRKQNKADSGCHVVDSRPRYPVN